MRPFLYTILVLFFLQGNSLKGYSQSNEFNLDEAIIEFNKAESAEDSFNSASKLVSHYTFNSPDSAKFYLNICLTASKEINDLSYQAVYHQLAANLYKTTGEYNIAIDNALSAYAYFDKLNDDKGRIEINTLIGHIYGLKGDFKKSLEYYNISIDKANELNLQIIKLNALIGKGNVLYYLEDYTSAEASFDEAVKISEKFNAGDVKTKAGLYANTGNLYLTKKDYIKAAELYQKSFNLYFKINDKFGMSLLSFNLGDAFLGLNEYDSAKKYFNINLFLGQELKSLEEIKYAYKGFTNLYEQLGDYQSAFENYKIYVAYADSARDQQYNSEVEKLTEEFIENEKLKLAEEELAYSKQLNATQSLFNRFLAAGIIVTIIGIIVFYILLRKSLKANKVILEKSKEIQEKNDKIDKALHQKDILLKEVHHRVKNNLQIIASLLNLQLMNEISDDAREALEESSSRVQAIALMHKGLYQDENFQQVNISKYIEELIDYHKNLLDAENRKIQFDVKIKGGMISIDDAVPIGLILTELISNSVKHAFKNSELNPLIKIQLNLDESGLNLRYQDNGVGLQPEQDLLHPSSMGYEIILALVDQINGSIEVISRIPVCLELKVKS
ncbi:MAG: tetratricopeptide repeat protein [Flavobacteriales bacterium]|nr:tetratricopeptide repeat protein [Flavobacteriales bacterium]